MEMLACAEVQYGDIYDCLRNNGMTYEEAKYLELDWLWALYDNKSQGGM